MKRPGSSWVAVVLGGIVPAALLAAAVLPPLLTWPALPARLADHWGAGGSPNGSLPKAWAVAVSLLTSFVGASLAGSWAARSWRRLAPAPGVLAAGLALCGTGAMTSLIVTMANLGATDWRQVRGPGLGAAVAVLGVPLALAGVALLAARRLGPLGVGQARGAGPAPRLGLAGAERALWVGTAKSRWALPVALGALAAAAVAALSGQWPLGVALGAVALASVEFTSVRAAATSTGVSVAYGPLRWPRQHIALGEITRAEPTEVTPTSWGYRGSLRLLGRAAVVIRGGEALRLELAGGRSLVVTIDDAATAAALINDELRRAEGAGRP